MVRKRHFFRLHFLYFHEVVAVNADCHAPCNYFVKVSFAGHVLGEVDKNLHNDDDINKFICTLG